MVDFDRVIDRGETPSYKCNKEFLNKVFGRSDLLPLWIADMDFEIAPAIKAALIDKSDFGVFGYEFKTEEQISSIIDWFQRYHGWAFHKDQMIFADNVLTGIAVAVNELTDQGDGIILQPPVYNPFSKIITNAGRQVAENPLLYDNGNYSINFEDLELKAREPRTKAIILCNPHNPMGKVWSAEDLQKIGEIAIANDLMILSDDIHADIVFEPYKYTAIASISESIAQRTITFLSPGKTFNLSGIATAVMVTKNEEYREKMNEFYTRYHLGNSNNALSMVAFEAGYRESREWFEALMAYLNDNVAFVRRFVMDKLANVIMVEPEGTYLVWLDMKGLELEPEVLKDLIVKKAGLALDFGHWLGVEGEGFVRLNIAMPRVQLEEALGKLEEAIKDY